MNGNTAVLRISEAGKVVSCFVPEFFSTFAELNPESIYDWLCEEDAARFEKSFAALLSGASHSFRLDVSPRGLPDAKLSLSASRLPGPDGPEYVVCAAPEDGVASAFLWGGLDNLPSPVFVKTALPDERYLYANDAYCRLVGCSRRDLLGKSMDDVFADKRDAHEFRLYMEADAKALQTGAVASSQLRFKIGGRVYVYETLRRSMCFLDSNPVIFGIGHDVTDRFNIETERVRMLEDLRNYSEQEGILNTCLKTLISDMEFPEVMKRVMADIMEFTSADYAGVYKFNGDYSRNYAQFVWTRDGAAPLVHEGYDYYNVRPEYKWFADFQNGVPMVMEDVENYALDDETRAQFAILNLK